MCSAEVNDKNLAEAGVWGWAWRVVVTDVEGVAKLEECCSLVESIGPHLQKCHMGEGRREVM